jgi:FKBP-type peptidyl-prolyl cis-trans isomerase FkpA
VINGWNEGLQLLGAGGKAILLVPSRLAYGEEGLKDGRGRELVPPNQVLIFELQVVKKL